MEIYRTDGGGKSLVDERLYNLTKEINKVALNKFFECIDVIRDHKGILMVKVNDNLKNEWFDLEYIYSVFLTFWYNEHEYLVSIYKDNICVYGYDLNNKIEW